MLAAVLTLALNASAAQRSVPALPNLLPVAPAAPMAPVLPTAQIPALPPFLAVAKPEHAEWLAGIVEKAQESPTARRILRDAEKMSVQQGRPVVVAVAPKGEWAAFDFDTGILWMAQEALRRTRENGASALAHELRHAIQLHRGLPDIFELELDAYMHDFAVAAELGDEPKPGSYDAKVRAAYKRGKLVPFLRKYYKNDLALHGRRDEYIEELEAALANERKARVKLESRIKEREAVARAMRAAGYPKAAVKAHVQDAVGPLKQKLAASDRLIAWIERDLAIQDDPRSAKRAMDFARRAVEKLERGLHRDD